MSTDLVKPPFGLKLSSIGKPVEIRVYLRDENGISNEIPGKYFGTLEAFWYNDTGLIFKLQGFDKMVTTWADHIVEAHF